jgi:hypothetical protein
VSGGQDARISGGDRCAEDARLVLPYLAGQLVDVGQATRAAEVARYGFAAGRGSAQGGCTAQGGALGCDGGELWP